MKLDFVLPLFGERGGAERALSGLGRQVMARSDWEVTIQTTCATSGARWDNDAPAGPAHDGRLVVNRHHVDSGRAPGWVELEKRVNKAAGDVDAESERAYFEAQGPLSSALAETLVGSDADLVLHMPYQYATTVQLSQVHNKPTVIWPAAHDDPALRLPAVGGALRAADALVFGTDAERRLTESIHPVSHLRQIVLGVGVGEHPGDAAAAARRVGIDDGRPWVLCVGRMLPGKGTEALASLWSQYARRRRPEHRLVLVGDRDVDIAAGGDLVVVGGVDEETKWGLLRGADLLVHPGTLESFGIVLLEAWAAGTAVLVNAGCEPTSDHVRSSRGGASYSDHATFDRAMSRLLGDAALRARMAAAGAAYWHANYTWDLVARRFMDFCERVVRFSPRAGGTVAA
ncbi:MAG TPA: hypothetical protein DEP66_04815 [Acidimicrobiaceae bacterium]|nr:hypothetical protein [Acidimicrobiaceae bacterium]